MKIRDRLPLLAVLCCFSALLLLPEISAQAARDAMLLCAQTLIPSLFPFFVLSSLLIACGASELLSALLSPLMRPLFGLSGAGAAALALGIGVQNFPEGAAVALPLRQAGKKRGEAFLAGVLSGAVEPLFGVAAALAAVQVRPLMPWLLSFAAGAMLCVTAEELIPRAGGRDGTCAFLIGFLLMMALDVGLG